MALSRRHTDPKDLRAVVSGLKWTSLSAIYLAGLQVTQLVILTHYLAPSDFGVVAVLMIFVGFVQTFLDMGLSNAIINRKFITTGQFASLYWLNISVSSVVAACFWVSASSLAEWYGGQLRGDLVKLMVPIFIIGSTATLYKTLFQRDLHFGVMAAVESVGVTLSFLASIIFASNEFGVYAIIYPAILNVVVTSLGFMLLGRRLYGSPKPLFRLAEINGFWSFGLFQLGERLSIYLSSQIDVLMIGKMLGSEAAGVYHVAKNLVFRVSVIVGPLVSRVTIPVMARAQANEKALEMYYLKSVYYLALLIAPIYTLIFLLSDVVVDIFLGAHWVQSIPILKVLAAYAFIRSVGSPIGSFLLAKNRPSIGFYWNVILLLFVPAVISISNGLGLIGVCLAMFFLAAFLKVPEYFLLIKPLSGIQLKKYFGAFIWPLSIAVLCALITLPIMLIDVDDKFNAFLISLSFGASYVVIILRYDISLRRTLIDFLKV